MNPNYIQLEIGEEKRGFKFGLSFLSNVLDHLGVGIEDLHAEMERNPFRVLPVMLYESFKSNELKARREFNVNLEDVYDWIDDSGGITGGPMKEFINAWTLSMKKDVPEGTEDSAENADQEVSKKKLTGQPT